MTALAKLPRTPQREFLSVVDHSTLTAADQDAMITLARLTKQFAAQAAIIINNSECGVRFAKADRIATLISESAFDDVLTRDAWIVFSAALEKGAI